MATWENPCSGLRWMTHSDGLIEVEGEGFPEYDQASLEFQQLAQNAANWGGLLRAAAARYGVPLPWLLAIATMETGPWADDATEQSRMVSPAGALGVMQIMPFVAEEYGYTPADMLVPESNIDVGAALIRRLADRGEGGLPAVSARYNSGRLCSPGRNEWNLLADANYPRKVIRWNNSAIRYGVGSSPHVLAGVALGAGGLYLAAAIAGLVTAPRALRRYLGASKRA